MGRHFVLPAMVLALACTTTPAPARQPAAAGATRTTTSHPRAPVIEETRADVDASAWIATLRARAAVADLPGRAEGILTVGLTPWGLFQHPGDDGWMIERFPIDIREIRRRGGYRFTVDGVHGWGVWSFTTVDPPRGGFEVETPSGPIRIDGRGVTYYAPAPGGPSHHVHVVALDVNGGRGAAPHSTNGLGTQQIEILDGTPAFAPVVDEVMAVAYDAWQDALHLHRHEVNEAIALARQRLEDLRQGVRLDAPLLREGFSLSYAPGRLTITFERRITLSGESGRDQALGSAAAVGLFASQPPLHGLHAEIGAHVAFEVVATADGRLAARWFRPTPMARYRCGESAPPPCRWGDERWRDVP